MSENQLKYYLASLRRYKKDGEDMVIWSVYNGRNIDGTIKRTHIKIKDLDEKRIKDILRKIQTNPSDCVKKSRIKILGDVILKRRIKKIEKICSKLEM